MMVLKAFWGSLGVMFDALGGVLEALWVILGVSGGSLGGLVGPLWRPHIDQDVSLRALDGFC